MQEDTPSTELIIHNIPEDTESIFIEINLIKTKCRSSHRRCSVKKVFLEISQNSQENTCARDSFNKVVGLRPAILLKKSL